MGNVFDKNCQNWLLWLLDTESFARTGPLKELFVARFARRPGLMERSMGKVGTGQAVAQLSTDQETVQKLLGGNAWCEYSQDILPYTMGDLESTICTKCRRCLCSKCTRCHLMPPGNIFRCVGCDCTFCSRCHESRVQEIVSARCESQTSIHFNDASQVRFAQNLQGCYLMAAIEGKLVDHSSDFYVFASKGTFKRELVMKSIVDPSQYQQLYVGYAKVLVQVS